MANQALLFVLAVFLAIATGSALNPYLGCYKNPTIAGIPGFQFGPGFVADTMTVEVCQAYCYGEDQPYAYIRTTTSGSTQNIECLCDPFGLSDFASKVADSVCSVQITGGSAGSTNAQYVSAYSTGFTFSFRLNRCVKNVTVLASKAMQHTNSPAACISWCSSKGFSAVGVTNGKMCDCVDYMSVVLGQGGVQTIDESNCNTPCSGLWSSMCGGPNGAMDIYPTEQIYQGCYVDSATSPVFSFSAGATSTNTVPACQDICYNGGYTFAALQAGNECFCGNNAGTLASSASDCNAPCSGDYSTTCGGTLRNSVYKAVATYNQPTKPSGWTQFSSSAFGVTDYATYNGRK